MSDTTPESSYLGEHEWRHLVSLMHAKRDVIPIIGPELVTIEDPQTKEEQPLVKVLGPRLALALNLGNPERYTSVSKAAGAHILRGGARSEIYSIVRWILDQLAKEGQLKPSTTLLELASITDFEFYISSTFDPLLTLALAKMRPSFQQDKNVLKYHPQDKEDLPRKLPAPTLYHILGNIDTFPDFVVGEEDYMEFMCGLIEQVTSKDLRNLRSKLEKSNFLFLGSPAGDWIVRFFLRMARQTRQSERGTEPAEYIADRPDNLDEQMVTFLNTPKKSTRVIKGDPGGFVRELAARWRNHHAPASSDDDFLLRMPDDLTPGAVFISYASEDLPAALKLARALASASIPVWLDKQKIKQGENYERVIRYAVKHCSYFVSIISKASESRSDRFLHQFERPWAAESHVDGYIFYLPVIIDDTDKPKLEPPCFSKIQIKRLPAGITTPDYLAYLRELLENYRKEGGHPRG